MDKKWYELTVSLECFDGDTDELIDKILDVIEAEKLNWFGARMSPIEGE